ncbi:MAG: hypothetical protein ACI8P3_004557 [Saprospiraceae bacterium]|jgi:hypothetical protein
MFQLIIRARTTFYPFDLSMAGWIFSIVAPNQLDRYQDTFALKQCSYFRKVINKFSCKKEAIRLMNLPADRVINTHTDHSCGYEDGVFRVHIPILTNEEVYFILNSQRLVMNTGEAWYTNVNLPHSVANKGQTNRVHLVIDCVRNKWSDDLFGSVGYNFEEEKEVEQKFPAAAIQLILKELENQDTCGAKKMIEKLKAQLSAK